MFVLCRERFIEPFYVNVIVLPDDRPCRRLPGHSPPGSTTANGTAGSGSREKVIKVTISKAPEYSTYVTPIALSAIWMFTIIFIR